MHFDITVFIHYILIMCIIFVMQCDDEHPFTFPPFQVSQIFETLQDDRWVVIDADQPIEAIQKQVRELYESTICFLMKGFSPQEVGLTAAKDSVHSHALMQQQKTALLLYPHHMVPTTRINVSIL